MRKYSLALVSSLCITGLLYGEGVSTEESEVASYCYPVGPVVEEKVEIEEKVFIKEECAKRKKPKFDRRDIRIAETDNTFAAYFQASYVQPSATNMHYAAEARPLPVPTPNWLIHSINPCYHVAYDVGVFGMIDERNSFVKINWSHLCSTDKNSVTVATTDMVGPFFTIGPDASAYTSATGKVNYYLQVGSVEYGSGINFGDDMGGELYMGGDYAYLVQTLEFEYSNASESISRTITTPSRFSGGGPKIGSSVAFRVVDMLSFGVEASCSLLYGCISNATKYESTSPLLSGLSITPPNTQYTTTSSRNQMIPAFKGQAGLAYSPNLERDFKLFIEAGYKTQIYVGALQSVDMGSEVPMDSVEDSTVGVYARTFQKNISNLALAGPYVAIELDF